MGARLNENLPQPHHICPHISGCACMFSPPTSSPHRTRLRRIIWGVHTHVWEQRHSPRPVRIIDSDDLGLDETVSVISMTVCFLQDVLNGSREILVRLIGNGKQILPTTVSR